MFSNCASTPPNAQATASPPRITILYDAFGNDPARAKDWGYAALVEINGKRILFNTGDDPDVLSHNVMARGVDREDDELPAEMRYFGGAPPATMKFVSVFAGARNPALR